MGLTAWMVFALTNLLAERPELVVYMVVCVAMLVGQPSLAPTEEKQGLDPRKLLAGAFAALSVGSLTMFGIWLQGDQEIYKSWSPEPVRLAAGGA
ncbi:MAG: hypothetical protein U0176_03645 [Bacteroidia bacterium]